MAAPGVDARLRHSGHIENQRRPRIRIHVSVASNDSLAGCLGNFAQKHARAASNQKTAQWYGNRSRQVAGKCLTQVTNAQPFNVKQLFIM